ncbi:hypothetical protein TNCV_3288041 [Trichonephila clavipes]|nr:hypothetical protein TNCV_3288041 [Trichonephila clavipes]
MQRVLWMSLSVLCRPCLLLVCVRPSLVDLYVFLDVNKKEFRFPCVPLRYYRIRPGSTRRKKLGRGARPWMEKKEKALPWIEKPERRALVGTDWKGRKDDERPGGVENRI